jgi:hypothetical protein
LKQGGGKSLSQPSLQQGTGQASNIRQPNADKSPTHAVFFARAESFVDVVNWIKGNLMLRQSQSPAIDETD